MKWSTAELLCTRRWLQEQFHSGNKVSVVTDLNMTLALHNPMPASFSSR